MVKRTLELFECDKCGAEGERWAVTFPDGRTLLMDRCPTHAKKLLALQDEQGEWLQPHANGKQTFRKATVDEIRQALGK